MANVLTKIPKFRRCVLQNFPFIEQDFDALTDYQLLCKVVEYLNKVINSQNEVIEITESLIAAFNELQSFVENYFANLDVQEEINNKLDQMAEAGTLQEIIGDYLNATAVWGFNTVASMKSSTNLINGSYAKTLGFHSLNDGGGALYKIREPDNDDVVDERLLIAIDDNLVAELVIENNTLNALKIGIKNDNTSNSDLGVLSAYVNKYDIYVPDGEYILEDNIEITRNGASFKCDGIINIDSLHSIIVKASKCNIEVKEIANGDYNGTGITITNKNTESTAYNNINVDVINQTNIGVLLLGTDAKGIQYNKINFNLIDANKGIDITLDSISSWVNENTFNGGRIKGTTGVVSEKIASQINAYNGNKFYNIAFEEIDTIAKLEKADHFLFTGLRTQESINGTYWFILDEDSVENEIHSQFRIYVNKIQDNHTSSNRPNIFYSNSIATSGGNTMSDKVKFIRGLPFIYNRPYFRVPIHQYYTEGNVDVVEDVYYNNMMVSCGCDSDKTLNLILPAVFADNGVTEFFLRVSYIGSGSTINIKDNSGNVIHSIVTTDGGMSAKYYKLSKNFYINNDLTPFWLVEEIQ